MLPVVNRTPVFAGVNATDPFAIIDLLLDRLKKFGFSGVQIFPTVGLFDGIFRRNLEETGMGYGHEVNMIRMANRRDMLTTPYVFSAEEAVAMTEAGADIIVAHMGLTAGGKIGATTALNWPTVPTIDEWAEAAKRVRNDIIVLCHGGPISSPADAEYILRHRNTCTAFMARVPWSGCRPRPRSPSKPRLSRIFRSRERKWPGPTRALSSRHRSKLLEHHPRLQRLCRAGRQISSL